MEPDIIKNSVQSADDKFGSNLIRLHVTQQIKELQTVIRDKCVSCFWVQLWIWIWWILVSPRQNIVSSFASLYGAVSGIQGWISGYVSPRWVSQRGGGGTSLVVTDG